MEVILDSSNNRLDLQDTTTEYKPEHNANDTTDPCINSDLTSTTPIENAQETFVSSAGLAAASNPLEWEYLVSRGTGSEQASSRWDRESLYQRFDPLVSQKMPPPPPKPSKLPNAARIESLKELIRRDESQFSSPPSSSKLISVDTPRKVGTLDDEINDNNNMTCGSNSTQSRSKDGTAESFVTSKLDFTDETFVSATELSNASNPLEWDLLISRGTGSEPASNRWDRESLYQRFDPLVSQRQVHSQLPKQNFNKLESLKEQVRHDEFPPSPPSSSNGISKLISIDTPSPQFTKNRSNMTLRAQAEVKDEPDTKTKFIEPLPETPEMEESVIPPESPPTQSTAADELEIEKLKEKLELQAQNCQNQLHNKSIQLQDLEASIDTVSKELEVQQRANRVLKEYEKSIENFESEMEKITKQIVQIEADKDDIAQERDFALEDLRHAECAFSDLHSKYEQVKELLSNFKKNEEILLRRYEEMKSKVENRDEKLKCLQGTVEDIFGKMKHNYESEIKAEELENQRYRAQVKKLEFRMATCEKDLVQKEKENTQLSLLCDDLIKGRQGKM